MKPLVLIEWNEVNVSFISNYFASETFKGRWPNVEKVLNLPKVETKSEQEYELLEPWIQWTSVHTGLSATKHGIFRLGEAANSRIPQIFETLEEQGHSIGCVSAMNVDNRLKQPSYFIPDPWINTKTDGSFRSQMILSALQQAVNDNSSGKLHLKTILVLLFYLATSSRIQNWPLYIKILLRIARKKRWNKALFLDLFLSDLHIKLHRQKRPNFSVVFFNALAHIQHHYFFSSNYYVGALKNPQWYIDVGTDPFTDALDVYDRIFKDILNEFGNSKILIATALQQQPFDVKKYYYRLKNHSEFLALLGFDKIRVHPRMTRDFLVEADTREEINELYDTLVALELNGLRIFGTLDKKGNSLFVTLTYPNEIQVTDKIKIRSGELGVTDHFVFVALKNGKHDQFGTIFSNSGGPKFNGMSGSHVASLYNHVMEHFKKS